MKKIVGSFLCLSFLVAAVFISELKAADSDPVVEVVTGVSHSLLLKNDGTVWAWGRNINGELGIGETAIKHNGKEVGVVFPTQVKNLTEIIDVDSGYFHSVALRNNGTVWAWGNVNSFTGRDISKDLVSVPTQINTLEDIVAISAGGRHSLALDKNGIVWTWGIMETTPRKVTNLPENIVKISSGDEIDRALDKDGRVWVWPSESNYQPIMIEGMDGIIEMADGGGSTSIFLKEDGTVWAWGDNSFGSLGMGDFSDRYDFTPVKVKNLENVVYISMGSANCYAVDAEGAVWVWGFNHVGQLGDGSKQSTGLPIKLSTVEGIKLVAASEYHALVADDKGNVWAWGDNDYGQLGTVKSKHH